MNSLTKKRLDLCSVLLLLTIMSTVLLSGIQGGNTFNLVITAVFVAVTITITLIGNRPVRLLAPFIVLALWICVALISSLMAADVDLALDRVETMIQILVLVLVVANVIIWSGRSEIFFLVYVLAAVFSYVGFVAGIGYGVVDVTLIEEGYRSGRATGLTLNANKFGTLMVLGQMAAVFVAVQATDPYKKALVLAAFLLLGVAIVHSGSRTALVGMALLVAGCAWIFRIWQIKNAVKAITTLILAFTIASISIVALKDTEFARDKTESFLSNESIAGRYENLLTLLTSAGDVDALDDANETSIFQRLQYAKYSWDAAISMAPLGMGLQNFTAVYGTYAHSNYMEILATTGFVGLFVFIWVYISLYVSAYKITTNRSENILLTRTYFVSLATLMVTDIANVSYYSKPFWVFVAIAIASIIVSQNAPSDETSALAEGTISK